jgi:hypothetical protein
VIDSEAGAEDGSKEGHSVTANLRTVMLDDPGPFEDLETWEQFLAEVEAMPDFRLKESVVEHARWVIAQKKPPLGARP